MARNIGLIVIGLLITIANLPGLVTCWNVNITFTKVVNLQSEGYPYINVVCHAPDLANCQARIYNYKRPKDGNINIDCSKADWTTFHWTGGNEAHCATHGKSCTIRLTTAKEISGRYVVGCRAKNYRIEGGGWKYNYTTIYSHDKTDYLEPLGKPVIVELGEDTKFACPNPEQPQLLQCIFSLPNEPDNDDVNLNHGLVTQNKPTNLDPRYSYNGTGLLNGQHDCVIGILNVTEEDNGIVWCRLKFQKNSSYAVRAFALIVAKPPKSKATLTFLPDAADNNTVHATCSVPASRPVASIKWLYNGGTVIREDEENELVTDDWFWPWDEQPITQTEKGKLKDENDQILCLVQHQESKVPTEKEKNSYKYVPLDSWQIKFNPKKPTTRIKPHGTADLLCNASVALKECGFQISEGPYYDASNTSEVLTKDKFYTLQNQGIDLEKGVCRLKFTAMTLGTSYRIGCRGRAKGGWKYAYTNLDVLDSVTCRLTDYTSNETVTPGSNVSLGCVEIDNRTLRECTISAHGSSKTLVSANFNLTQQPSKLNFGRYRYLAKDGKTGVCGAIVHNVAETDNGIIKLQASTSAGAPSSRTIYFPVAKPPQEVRLYGMHTSQYQLGDTLVAYCAVSECRPPATITWYLGDDVIDSDANDVTIGELLDHEWRWMIDARNVTQRFTKKMAASDNGKRLSCAVSHVAWKGETKTDSFTIKILVPSTTSSPPPTKNHGPGLAAPPKTTNSDHSRKDAASSTGIVIGLAVAILIVIGIMVAVVVYSKIKRIWCFTEQQSATPSKHERAMNETVMDDVGPLYAVVNMDTKNKNKSRPGAAGHSGAAIQDGAAIYAVVNKDTKKNKKAIPGVVGQTVTSNQNGSGTDDGLAIYAVVNKDTKNKKAIPGAVKEDESVLYSVVNKEQKNKKKAPLGTPNQKVSTKEEASVIYSVVNKETKIKKKSTPGKSAAADSSVIYAEIVNTNAGKPAGKPKAALPQENVEYTDLTWH